MLALANRDLASRPFRDWDEAFELFRQAASEAPLIVILDEFPELIKSDLRIESALRAIWESMGDRPVRLVLCGSAVRTTLTRDALAAAGQPPASWKLRCWHAWTATASTPSCC